MKILLACQTATNKGDRAIAEFVIGKLLDQGHEVVLSTTRPNLWEELYAPKVRVIEMGYRSIYKNVRNSFLRKGLWGLTRFVLDPIRYANLIAPKGKHRLCRMLSREFIDAVQEADLVIVTGGHHITSIREKNALFQFTYDIGLISLYAKRYVLWSQTIGPLEFTSKKAKIFIGDTIKKAEKVFIRDENSAKCIENHYGKLDNVVKTYDSVFGYGSMDFPAVENREKKVGIALFDGLKKAYGTFDTLAKMLDHYAAQGYKIQFFRMEHSDHEQQSIQTVIGKMEQKADITVHPFMTTTEEHLRQVASCRCFIGYKTHSVIMALTTATPLVAICYHKKTADFMADFGLGAYALPDEDLTYEQAAACMDALDKNITQIQQKQREIAKTIAQQLENDLCEMIEHV